MIQDSSNNDSSTNDSLTNDNDDDDFCDKDELRLNISDDKSSFINYSETIMIRNFDNNNNDDLSIPTLDNYCKKNLLHKNNKSGLKINYSTVTLSKHRNNTSTATNISSISSKSIKSIKSIQSVESLSMLKSFGQDELGINRADNNSFRDDQLSQDPDWWISSDYYHQSHLTKHDHHTDYDDDQTSNDANDNDDSLLIIDWVYHPRFVDYGVLI